MRSLGIKLRRTHFTVKKRVIDNDDLGISKGGRTETVKEVPEKRMERSRNRGKVETHPFTEVLGGPLIFNIISYLHIHKRSPHILTY